MAPRAGADDRRLLTALGLLTVVTGLVDSASVLGLGGVFTANMTGNVVYLGFSLAGSTEVSPPAMAILALAGFFVGAVLGGRLSRPEVSFRSVLLAEVVVLLPINAVVWLAGDQGIARVVLIGSLGLAMGAQTAMVRRLNLDMTTTVLSLTLAGLASDSRLGGGNNPHAFRREASVLLLLAGAFVGALLLRMGTRWTLGAAELVAVLAWATVPASVKASGPPRPPAPQPAPKP